jgi:hypothetical protein
MDEKPARGWLRWPFNLIHSLLLMGFFVGPLVVVGASEKNSIWLKLREVAVLCAMLLVLMFINGLIDAVWGWVSNSVRRDRRP